MNGLNVEQLQNTRIGNHVAGLLLRSGTSIKFKPDYASAYNKIGLILFQQGKFEKAEVFFSKALQIDPNYSEPRKNLEMFKRTKPSNKT